MTSSVNFRFHLEGRGDHPHSLTKQKYPCPGCGEKSFVRYIDRETGRYLADDCGKCDRLNNCGYHYPPRELFRDRPECLPDMKRKSLYRERIDWLGKEQGFDGVFDFIPKRILPDELRPVHVHSRFFFWLLGLFDRHTPESPTALRILGDYGLGATADGRVLFYQIQDRQIRTAKIMDYDKETGYRRGNVSWLHTLPSVSKHYPTGFRLQQCLFGTHLLARYPDKPVCVVEAEKTACVMAGIYPDTLWLATGGATVNLGADSLAPLKGRRVIFYPDASPGDKIFKDWQARTALYMPSNTPYRVDDSLTGDKIPEAGKEKGIDLVDIYLR